MAMDGCSADSPVFSASPERMLHVKNGIQQNRKQPDTISQMGN
jgi:hypothetical protein